MQITEQDLTELRVLEERLWIAEFRFDRVWMDNILADDFFEFGRSGRVYSRKECLDVDGDHPIDAVIPLPEFKARYVGSDTVQTTYKSVVTYNGETEYGNRSSIWLKTSDSWKLKFHQGTPTEK